MLANFPYKTERENLKSVKLVEEKDKFGCRKFYLDVTYTYIDDKGNKHEINFLSEKIHYHSSAAKLAWIKDCLRRTTQLTSGLVISSFYATQTIFMLPIVLLNTSVKR